MDGLRGGKEYDPYKNSLVFSQINDKDLSRKSLEEIAFKTFAGSYNPMMSTLSRGAKVYDRMTSEKSSEKTKQKYKDEFEDRILLEAAGNLGFIPFYKDIRRMVLKDMFKD